MKPIARVGLDIAKSVFQLHGVNVRGYPEFCVRGHIMLIKER